VVVPPCSEIVGGGVEIKRLRQTRLRHRDDGAKKKAKAANPIGQKKAACGSGTENCLPAKPPRPTDWPKLDFDSPVIKLVDDAIAVTVGRQLRLRAERIPPDGIVGRVDITAA
jgi:hypothetical protein